MKSNLEIWEHWASVGKIKNKQHTSSEMGTRVALAKEWLTQLEGENKSLENQAPWLSLVAGSLTTEGLKLAD